LAFAAALSWFVVAFIALVYAVLGVVLVITFQAGITIGLLGAVIPFFIGRGIIGRSEAAGVLGLIYAFGLFLYSIYIAAGSGQVLVLLWLAIASGASTVEMRTSDRRAS
jgi:hypothetical protein